MIIDQLKIRTYVIWIPMLDKDEGAEVPHVSKNVNASPQYFDGNMLIGNALARASGITETVWDTFLFYPAGMKWGPEGLPFPDKVIAQQGGVVVGTDATLPPVADQSRLLPSLRGRMKVIGEQSNFESILTQVATSFARQ